MCYIRSLVWWRFLLKKFAEDGTWPLGVENWFALPSLMNSLISLIYLFLISFGSIVNILSFREEASISLRTLVILTFLEIDSLGSLTYTLSKFDGETNWVGFISRKLQLVAVSPCSLLRDLSMLYMPFWFPCFNSSFVRNPLDIMNWGRLMLTSPVTIEDAVIDVNLDLS